MHRLVFAFPHLLQDKRLDFVSGPSAFLLPGNACHFDYMSGFSPASFVHCLAHLFRCVQGTLTYSPGADDARLLGIPAS